MIVAWAALLVASSAFIAMLISTWRHQAGAVELVWSLIPWLIVALCVTPSVFELTS